MAIKVALVYYANPDHYSVNATNRYWLINGGYEKLIKSAQIPINVSFLGSTLKEINEQNPSHLKRLNALQIVKYFFSSYSHFLTKEFSEDAALQIIYGKKFITKYLHSSKLMNIFAFPEYDLQQKWGVLNKQKYGFNCFLCQNSVLNHKSLSRCAVSFQILPEKQEVLCVHKNLSYRKMLHKYLREECSSEEVVSAIKTDFHSLKNQSLLLCAIDLEVAVLNRVQIKPNLLSPRRIDLINKLFQGFSNSDIDFVYLDSPVAKTQENKKHISSLSSVSVSVKRSSHYNKVYQFLKSNREILLDNIPLKYFESTTSDFFTYNQKDLVYPSTYKKYVGKVIIKRSGLKKTNLKSKLKVLKEGLKKVE